MTSLYDKFIQELPVIKPFKIRNGVDAYGFTKLLSRRLGKVITPRVFADWLHGWRWAEPSRSLFDVLLARRDLTIIVCTPEQATYLRNEGFHDVRVGGLPFVYTPSVKQERLINCLLAIPTHSTPHESIVDFQNDYFDYLETLKKDFEEIFVMIHYCDLGTELQRNAELRGLKTFLGAQPNDLNSLLRVRKIMSQVDFVSSNVIGSHMVYALYSGCKFSLCGPIYDYSCMLSLVEKKSYPYSKKQVESFIETSQRPYLEKRFGKFFVAHPREGVSDIKLAREESGADFTLSDKDLVNALGWNFGAQVSGYLSGSIRRLERLKRKNRVF